MIEIVVGIEKRYGFLVKAQSCPSVNFKELFERAYTTRHGDETVCEFRHFRFPFMHVGRDVKLRELWVRCFIIGQCINRNPDYFTICSKSGVRD